MRLIRWLWDTTGGALLVRSQKAGTLTTPGRKSGAMRTVRCGYLRRPAGTILVGSAEGRQWPQNLEAAGWCYFEGRGLPRRRYRAERLKGDDRDAAIEDFRRARGDRATSIFSGAVFELTAA